MGDHPRAAHWAGKNHSGQSVAYTLSTITALLASRLRVGTTLNTKGTIGFNGWANNTSLKVGVLTSTFLVSLSDEIICWHNYIIGTWDSIIESYEKVLAFVHAIESNGNEFIDLGRFFVEGTHSSNLLKILEGWGLCL
jgi:hypothetical protein